MRDLPLRGNIDFSPVSLRRKKLNFAAAMRQNNVAAGSGYRGVIPHCSGKFFSFHFSSTYYLVFAAAVKKVHLPLQVVPIIQQYSPNNFRTFPHLPFDSRTYSSTKQ